MSDVLTETTSATTPPPTGEVAALPPLTAEVREFCDKYGLLEYLPATFRLLREEVAPVGEIEMELKDDGEEDFRRLILAVPVRGEVPQVLANFDRFLERWIPLTTPDVQMRIVAIWTFRA